MQRTGWRLVWAIGPLLALLTQDATAFFWTTNKPAPSRVRRANIAVTWCPDVLLSDGWEPVLQRIITEGPHTWGDSGSPKATRPPWLDKKRYRAGKDFVNKYLLTIGYAHLHGLALLLAIPSVLDVLVFTGNSDTPDKAFIRYFDTINGVAAWYGSDMFKNGTRGNTQLDYVRSLHNLVRVDMNENKDPEGVRNKTRLDGNFSGCPISKGLRRDLDKLVHTNCPAGGGSAKGAMPDENNTTGGDKGTQQKGVYMSQYDMAITQWAFVGLVVQFPERYGLGNVTERELDGFVHLWEVIGYSLGIDDRFNFCQGGLQATVRRARQALGAIVLPRLREASPPWEYMARCMSDGLGYIMPGVDFRTQLANLLRYTLDSPSPSVEALLTPQQRESASTYRGVMKALGKDTNRVLWTSLGIATPSLLNYVPSLPKENLRKGGHRPPHRTKDCYPVLRP